MTDHAGQAEKARRFLALHQPGRPLLLPNPWDRGSARLLASLGFEALATTSSGFAATLGRLDGSVTRDEAIGHAAAIVEATDLPVSADLENGFADDPDGVAETLRPRRSQAGLAGCSVEDSTGRPDAPIYDRRAGGRAGQGRGRGGPRRTGPPRAHRPGRELPARPARPGRHHRPAPGLPGGRRRRALRPWPAPTSRTSAGSWPSVDRPVNVLALPGAPPVAELAAAGVSRVSVGGAFAFAALGAVVEAATELPPGRHLRLLGPRRPRRRRRPLRLRPLGPGPPGAEFVRQWSRRRTVGVDQRGRWYGWRWRRRWRRRRWWRGSGRRSSATTR